MQHSIPLPLNPAAFLAQHRPDAPIMFFAPAVLQNTARRFQADFDGLVTYAVKANDRPEILSNLVAAGISTFDVASPAEMRAVRAACPHAVLHYNNPVRSVAEVEAGIDAGVFYDLYVALGESLGDGSWSVRIYYKPFIRWIWFGGFLIMLGGFLAIGRQKSDITSEVL